MQFLFIIYIYSLNRSLTGIQSNFLYPVITRQHHAFPLSL